MGISRVKGVVGGGGGGVSGGRKTIKIQMDSYSSYVCVNFLCSPSMSMRKRHT